MYNAFKTIITKRKSECVGFAKKEWLLVLSSFGLLLTSLYLHRLPSYSRSDFEILYILFVLFVVTTGLQKHHVVEMIARRLEQGRFIPAKLVLATFFFSMLVTNDVALLAIVPLTMLLRIGRKEWLIILETLAANAGSALSPFGNPQNLFIYWFYDVPLSEFIKAIALFSAVFLVLLLAAAFTINSNGTLSKVKTRKKLSLSSFFYLGALLLFALAILHVLPFSIGWLIILYAVIADRDSLHVDYALLITFWCFFGFTDNLHVLLTSSLSHPHHVFLLSALLSQFISNVPAALLLADFTTHWKSLLWGVSVGGFGSLVGSLANLIAYRLYIQREKQRLLQFTIKFHTAGYLAFFIGVSLYLLISRAK